MPWFTHSVSFVPSAVHSKTARCAGHDIVVSVGIQYYAKVVKGVSSEENAEMMMAEFNVIGDKISFTGWK